VSNEEKNFSDDNPFSDPENKEQTNNGGNSVEGGKLEDNDTGKQLRRRRYSLEHKSSKKLTMMSNWEEIHEESMLEKIIQYYFENVFLSKMLTK
jgi:hypothetical protein